METLDAQTREMVAVAASVAGNCIPCLEYHFKEAVKASCTKEQLQEVIQIANMVKRNPINEINKLSVQMLGNMKEEKGNGEPQ